MSLSGWITDQIEARSRHHRLVWVHDPYELVEPGDLGVLTTSLRSAGHDLISAKNVLQLREGLEGREGPAKRHWYAVHGFEDVWNRESRECRDLINEAAALRNDLDYLFGKLLEARYSDLVPGEYLTTDQLHDQWIGPRRRGADGTVRKAVILVIDSMRLDIWRELVKPALERDYIIDESLALARLPSETRVSRRCFFAGKPPAEISTGQINRFQKGTYYVPQIRCDAALLSFLSSKVESIRRSQNELFGLLTPATAVMTSNASATSGFSCSEAFLDYIFTDPAYIDKVQYGELNFIWDSWLGFDGNWLPDEIVVNPLRGKLLADWDAEMRKVFAVLYVALKPGRWMSLCYHDTDAETWTRVQRMLLDSGFEIHSVTVLDPKQKSQNQLSAEKVVKSDLVVNCRKPRPGDHSGDTGGEIGLVSARVRQILVETLGSAGGQSQEPPRHGARRSPPTCPGTHVVRHLRGRVRPEDFLTIPCKQFRRSTNGGSHGHQRLGCGVALAPRCFLRVVTSVAFGRVDRRFEQPLGFRV
jgi:hypothetical protein